MFSWIIFLCGGIELFKLPCGDIPGVLRGWRMLFLPNWIFSTLVRPECVQQLHCRECVCANRTRSSFIFMFEGNLLIRRSNELHELCHWELSSFLWFIFVQQLLDRKILSLFWPLCCDCMQFWKVYFGDRSELMYELPTRIISNHNWLIGV